MTLSLIVIILAVVCLAAAGAAILVTVVRQRQREVEAHERARDFERRQAKGLWASATIISAQGWPSGGQISTRATYDLQLEVTAPGGETYIARTSWLVELAYVSNLQQGQQISVKIDPQDIGIIYPNVGWAKFIPG